MAHWAKIDETKRVVQVIVAGDDAEEWLTETLGGTWLQTSYNTHGGVHYTDGEPSEDQSKAFRKNFAGRGFTYDEDRDAFIPQNTSPTATLDEETCLWVEIVEPSA